MSSSATPPPSPPPSPRGRGSARLVVVAVCGAGAVLGFQALTSSGSGNAGKGQAAQPGRPVAAATGTTAALGHPAGAKGSPAPAGGAAASGGAASGGAASGGAADAVTAAPPAAVSGPRLVVVIDQPRGQFAQQNRLILQGATLAVDQLNASGGVGHQPVRLKTEHLDGLAPAAVQSRLRADGPGAVLVLPCDADSQFSLARGAAPYRTLMLAPCDADASLAQTIPSYWPVGMAGNDEMAGLAGFMQRIGYSTVFVVNTPGLRYTAAMTTYFRAAMAGRNIPITGTATISTAVTPAEIKRVADAIKAAPPSGAVFSALPPPYFDELAAGLKHDGVGAPHILLGTSALDTPLTLSAAPPALQNATFATYGLARETPPATAFVNAYRARFGPPIGAFPGLGFETIRLLEAAVSRAGSSAPAMIGQALAAGTSLAGVALFDRSYKPGANHDPITPVAVEKIYGRGFLPLLTSAPTGSPKP